MTETPPAAANGKPSKRIRIGRILRHINQIFVAVGAICGVISVLWQLRTEAGKNERRLDIYSYVIALPGMKEFELNARVANKGNAPVYISLVAIASSDPNLVRDDNRVFIDMAMKDAHPTDPIPSGAFREFNSVPIPRSRLEELIRKNADAVILDVQTQSGNSFTLRDFGDALRRALLLAPTPKPAMIALHEPVAVAWREDH